MKKAIIAAKPKSFAQKDTILLGKMIDTLKMSQEKTKPQKIEELYLEYYHRTANVSEFEKRVEKYGNDYLQVPDIEAIRREDSIRFVKTFPVLDASKFSPDMLGMTKKMLKNVKGRPIAMRLNRWAWANYEVAKKSELLDKAFFLGKKSRLFV